jgi:membrane protease YdiL (CAAX protease family)
MSHRDAGRRSLGTSDAWRQLAAFTVSTFAWTWGIAAVLALLDLTAGAEAALFAVAVFGSSVSGVALTAHFQGRSGVADLWRRATRWRVGAGWYAAVLVVLPALIVLAAAVQSTRSGDDVLSAAPSAWPVIVVATLALGPLGEELGWRGFALPRLLGLMPAMPASLLLGVVWAMWHWPAFWLGVPGFDTVSPLPHLIAAVLLTIIMTGVYLRTDQSVLVSGILVHTVVNSSLAILHVSLWALVAAEAVAALLVVMLSGPAQWSGRPSPTAPSTPTAPSSPSTPAAPARGGAR